MRNRKLLCLVFGPLFVFVSIAFGLNSVSTCLAEAPVESMNQVIGQDWVLTQMHGKPVPVEPPVTLTFGIEENLVGSGGCNQFFGPYKFDSGQVTVGPLGATKMMCEPDIMKIEYAFLAALAGTFDLTADKNTMTLCNKDKTSCLVFKAK